MLSKHDRYALEYDRLYKEYHCHLADVLFGLCYETITPGESILDVGIGTGISSVLFNKAGLRVLGIDGSPEMLTVCRGKQFAQELIEQDILDLPWPFNDSSIHHVISCGVFHFLGDLQPVIQEIHRVQGRNGLFAFTIMRETSADEQQEDFKQHMEDDIAVYTHRMEYIEKTLKTAGYIMTKDITCHVGDTAFCAICAQCA